jgi:hypothetical protein
MMYSRRHVHVDVTGADKAHECGVVMMQVGSTMFLSIAAMSIRLKEWEIKAACVLSVAAIGALGRSRHGKDSQQLWHQQRCAVIVSTLTIIHHARSWNAVLHEHLASSAFLSMATKVVTAQVRKSTALGIHM